MVETKNGRRFAPALTPTPRNRAAFADHHDTAPRNAVDVPRGTRMVNSARAHRPICKRVGRGSSSYVHFEGLLSPAQVERARRFAASPPVQQVHALHVPCTCTRHAHAHAHAVHMHVHMTCTCACACTRRRSPTRSSSTDRARHGTDGRGWRGSTVPGTRATGST